jgi:hypothetical protein
MPGERRNSDAACRYGLERIAVQLKIRPGKTGILPLFEKKNTREPFFPVMAFSLERKVFYLDTRAVWCFPAAHVPGK